jgi:hypothetical protein
MSTASVAGCAGTVAPLLHDAAPGGSRHETLKPLLARLDRDPGFARLPDVGSFVTYRAR